MQKSRSHIFPNEYNNKIYHILREKINLKMSPANRRPFRLSYYDLMIHGADH